MKKVKSSLIGFLCIVGMAAIAMIVHAVMPSPGATADITQFDSILVRTLSFPVVATLYFVVLYLQIFLSIRYFGMRTTMHPKQVGLRYGIAFALLYTIGMQEIATASSPFSTWGVAYVLYQLPMGIGDAIPAFLLCSIVAGVFLRRKNGQYSRKKESRNKQGIWVCVIAAVFFVERVIGYQAGYVQSEIKEYPVPVLVWTAVFGVVLGVIVTLIRPIYTEQKGSLSIPFQSVVLTLGINWMWFNGFIGLIMKGTMPQMLVRSGSDVIVLFLTSLCLEHILEAKDSGCKLETHSVE